VIAASGLEFVQVLTGALFVDTWQWPLARMKMQITSSKAAAEKTSFVFLSSCLISSI